MPRYKRILLKLSGEALMTGQEYGINPDTLTEYAKQIIAIHEMGIQVAIVVGGGNIFRGIQASRAGLDRANGDYMGMLATVINALALQDAIETLGTKVRVQSAIEMNRICEPYIRRRAIRHLEKGRIVVFAAGTGNPFFTTDTAAGLRAIEIEAEVVLKGTRVDGIYNADPEKNAGAVMYKKLTYTDVLRARLNVMDMTAFTLCQENNLPIIVFNINDPENLRRILEGEEVGTLVER